jgi:iron(III) transport system substrate-binding protein
MVASELSRRSVRKDVDPAEGLKAIKDINIIQDDADVVKDNKQAWIDKFKEIFTNK